MELNQLHYPFAEQASQINGFVLKEEKKAYIAGPRPDWSTTALQIASSEMIFFGFPRESSMQVFFYLLGNSTKSVTSQFTPDKDPWLIQ